MAEDLKPLDAQDPAEQATATNDLFSPDADLSVTPAPEAEEAPVDAVQANSPLEPAIDAPAAETADAQGADVSAAEQGDAVDVGAADGEAAPVGAEAVDAPAPSADASAEPAATEAPLEVTSLPLDSSAPSDASPAPEAIADQGDATAPVEAEAVPELAPLDAPEPTQASSSASDSEEAPKADDSKPADEPAQVGSGTGNVKAAAGTDTNVEGDKGLGATHLGTDTPEVLVSNPCDPVTGKPLHPQGNVAQPPITGGGVVPPKSEVGHVIPGDGLEPDASSSQDAGAEDDDGGDSEDEGEGEDSSLDFGVIYDKLCAIEGLVADVRDALDGYEEC